MNRAVIYATNRHLNTNIVDLSIKTQIDWCIEYAEKNDIEVVGIYRDKDITVRAEHRPGFQQMIEDSHKGEFDTLLVWSIDRFARNVEVAEKNFDILSNNNVKVDFVENTFTLPAERLKFFYDSLENALNHHMKNNRR